MGGGSKVGVSNLIKMFFITSHVIRSNVKTKRC